jgi:hypothetical protein
MKRIALLSIGVVLFFARPALAQEEDQGEVYTVPSQQPQKQTPAQPASAASTDPPPNSSPDQPPKQGDEDPAKKVRLSLRGGLGYALQPLHGVPVSGGRLRLGVGGQTDSSAHYAMVSFLYGATEEGLRTWDARVGWTGDFYRTGILRLGVDVEMGYLFVRRATFDDRMWALGVGPRNDHALTVEGRFDVHLHFGPAVMWGPTLLLGFRY